MVLRLKMSSFWYEIVKYNLRILYILKYNKKKKKESCQIATYHIFNSEPILFYFKNGKFSIAYSSKEYDTSRNLDYGFLEIFLKSR